MPKAKKNEAKQDFLGRCTRELIDKEGREADQAYAMCNAIWDETKHTRPIMALSAPIEVKLSSEDAATEKGFMITAYTGAAMDTWFGPLILDVAGMQTKEKMPILREHERDRVVGFGRSFKDKKKTTLFVEGVFSKSTNDALEVLNLAEEGYPWQASVAVRPIKVKRLESNKESHKVNGEKIEGPAEIWLESDVGEVSFVSLGRDDNTAAITLSDTGQEKVVELVQTTNKPEIRSNEKMELTLEYLKENAPDLIKQIEQGAFDAGRKEGHEAGVNEERARVVELLDVDADDIETKKAIKAGTSVPDAYKLFYEAEKAKRAHGLNELEANATESQGHEEPVNQLSPKKPETKEEKAAARKNWTPVGFEEAQRDAA